jgi:hypothetical protein
MSGEYPSPQGQLNGERVRGRIIVARDQPDLWQALTRCFVADESVQVLFDRRKWERRQRIQTCEPERRETDRRRPISMENDLRRRSFVVATE